MAPHDQAATTRKPPFMPGAVKRVTPQIKGGLERCTIIFSYPATVNVRLE